MILSVVNYLNRSNDRHSYSSWGVTVNVQTLKYQQNDVKRGHMSVYKLFFVTIEKKCVQEKYTL